MPTMGPDLKNSRQNEVRRRAGGPLWFVAGGIVAAVIMFAFPAIKGALRHAEKSTVAHAGRLKDKLTRTPPGATASGSGPHFDFYQLLAHPTQILTSGESSEVATPPASNPVAVPGSYILQVASFRDARDAEALKAQLALWGVQAQVQPVDVQGETWHRVRVGPIADLHRLNALRGKLAAHKLQPMVIRVGAGQAG